MEFLQFIVAVSLTANILAIITATLGIATLKHDHIQSFLKTAFWAFMGTALTGWVVLILSLAL